MGGKGRCIQVLVGKPEASRPLEDTDVHGRIMSKLILKKWDGSMNWIDLAQHKDRCQGLVSVVINLHIS
jgi:hypothetical protein